MDFGNVAAWYAAIVATGVAVWDVIKWRQSGARLRVSVSADMQVMPPTPPYGDGSVILVEVINVGSKTTTLTNVLGQVHSSRFARLMRRKPAMQFVVPNPAPGRLPHVLAPGERWTGVLDQDGLAKLPAGELRIGVAHVLSKRTIYRPVRIERE